MEPQSCCGSIPILESTVTVSRDIPAVLVGKMHWIEWSLFCDRLDEALQPLRRKTKQSSFRFRHRSVKSKVLKNLQRTCDKEVSKHAALQDLILYCPNSCDGKKNSVTNWHIQVVVRGEEQEFDASALLDVPMDISIPSPTNSDREGCSQSAPFGLPFWPDLGQQPMAHSHPASEHFLRRQYERSSSSLSSSEEPFTNPFVDDPQRGGLAMSRDGLMELDRLLERESWMGVPSFGGDYHRDALPIPMPPPAPVAKIV